MRIIYFINGFDPGGAEHGLLTLLDNGFFDGHELHVFALCKGKGNLWKDVSDAVGIDNFVLVSEKENLSIRTLLPSLMRFYQEVRVKYPDAVVLSLKQANIVGRLILTFFPAVHCISFEHIAEYKSNSLEWIYKYLLWLTSYRVNEVWADCRETLDSTKKYFMPIRKRLGVSVPLYCAGDNLPIKASYGIQSQIKLLAAGRLVERKNFDHIIEVVKMLREQHIDATLDIFGTGSIQEQLLDKAVMYGVDDYVNFKGYRHDWVNESLTYDIFVNASSVEGFCIVVAEAMGVGLPVVATNIGGIKEYGVDYENMIKLNDHNNIQALYESIKTLISNDDLRERIGKAAASQIRLKYGKSGLKLAGKKVFLGGDRSE